MEKYKTLEQDIENVTNKKVIKQNRISGIAVGLLVIAMGAFAGGLGFEDPNSSMPTFLFTASAILFLCGIIKLFVNSKAYLFCPTKSRLKNITVYFHQQESDALQNCFELKRFEELKKLKREKDSGVKVEAMVAGDGKFAAIQISEYIPYTYEAVTPVMCYYGEEAQCLAEHFRRA